ncbi:DUF4143 domain-containing protein [Chlorobium sp.]|uniref:DUF4143 domain-containing protein n=1 Tax=Chlorobium sp. TaxID=1095 RepID=UPI0034238B69
MFRVIPQKHGRPCLKRRLLFFLLSWFANIGKRLVKSPKLYFYDVGLATCLAGITKESHLAA